MEKGKIAIANTAIFKEGGMVLNSEKCQSYSLLLIDTRGESLYRIARKAGGSSQNMAVDIKKLVDKISSLTVLELSKLVKALRDKLGFRTSVIAREDTNEVAETEAVTEESTEVTEESTKSEPEQTPEQATPPESTPPQETSTETPETEETTADSGALRRQRAAEKQRARREGRTETPPVLDLSSVPVPDASPVKRPNPPPVKRPKGENYDLVYAWKYSGDNRYAKIGRSTKILLNTRMPGTYHPTDNPELIGTYKCDNLQHAEDIENYILSKLKRTRPDREWVEIDKTFNEMIEEYFSSLGSDD